MILLYKDEVIMHFFIPAPPLKVKLVSKYFFKNMSKQGFIANFQFSKFLLSPNNEHVALIAFKLSDQQA